MAPALFDHLPSGPFEQTWAAPLALTVAGYFILSYITTWWPLRKIPGPMGAKLSSWSMVSKGMLGDRVRWIHDLHQEYGTVVQAGLDLYIACSTNTF